MIPRLEGDRWTRSCCNNHICVLHHSFSLRVVELTPLVYERMAPEAVGDGEGYEQWNTGTIHFLGRSQEMLTRIISIYLLGFTASAGHSEIEAKVTLMTDRIQHLVPEARTFAPHKFWGYAALNLPDLYTEDDQNTNSIPGEVNEREEPDGSEVQISEIESVGKVAVKEIEPPLTQDKGLIGDSVFVSISSRPIGSKRKP